MTIAEILKYCPEGTKLYSPIYGEVTFKGISSTNSILCRATHSNGKISVVAFNSIGMLQDGFSNSECVLFPSKRQRDWTSFQIPVERGDIMMFKDKSAVFIVDTMKFGYTNTIAYVDKHSNFRVNQRIFVSYIPASKDMKKKLFEAIDKAGYTWDSETLKKKESQFKPFDKVLVRDHAVQKWMPTMYAYYDDKTAPYFHNTMNGHYLYCIPFEGNEHLAGTTNNP